MYSKLPLKFIGLLLVGPLAFGQTIDGKALLDLLVRKGVVTPAEATTLQTELAGPAVKPAPVAPAKAPAAVPISEEKKNPLAFRIGIADFTPVGFMDFTVVHRTTNLGSGIGTNFAAIPFGNTSPGRLSETRFSAQNSRLGLRIDSLVNTTKVLGYVESDFLGNAPSNLGVSSNAATLRMRLYFASLSGKNWDLLGGQEWSLMTVNRKGIGAMPADIFITSNVDTNFQAGVVWARQAQLRGTWHVTPEFTAAVSLENPDQYAGGTNGCTAVTFPTGFNTSQVDTGAATTSPNMAPDVVAKLAYDTQIDGRSLHFEAAGLYRTFKVNNYVAGATPVDVNTTKAGLGGSVAANLELLKGLNLIGTGFWSSGGGRYIFGQAPDFSVLPPNAGGAYEIKPLRANSYLVGTEWQAMPKTLLFGYYSHVSIGSAYGQQANGSYVGYGFPGSPSSNNHHIEQYSIGGSHTLWKNPSYGALVFMTQVAYLRRTAYSIPVGTPKDAHSTMLFFDFRYVLP